MTRREVHNTVRQVRFIWKLLFKGSDQCMVLVSKL
jgi:hypothetical protein